VTDATSIDPRTLTKAERLEVSRRRAGLTQHEAADLLGWTLDRYKWAERGEAELQSAWPAPALGGITSAEECRLLRRRAGLTIAGLAAVSGLAARWIHHAEKGNRDPAALLEYWRGAA